MELYLTTAWGFKNLVANISKWRTSPRAARTSTVMHRYAQLFYRYLMYTKKIPVSNIYQRKSTRQALQGVQQLQAFRSTVPARI
jgi:hypothetical protein